MSWISKRWKIQGIPPLNISQYVAERIKKQKKQKNKISIVKKWKKVWKTQGHQFLYLMVCLTHVYMADIKHLLVLLNAQEGKHPCSKRLPFLRKWEAEGKRFLHQLYSWWTLLISSVVFSKVDGTTIFDRPSSFLINSESDESIRKGYGKRKV